MAYNINHTIKQFYVKCVTPKFIRLSYLRNVQHVYIGKNMHPIMLCFLLLHLYHCPVWVQNLFSHMLRSWFSGTWLIAGFPTTGDVAKLDHHQATTNPKNAGTVSIFVAVLSGTRNIRQRKGNMTVMKSRRREIFVCFHILQIDLGTADQ